MISRRFVRNVAFFVILWGWWFTTPTALANSTNEEPDTIFLSIRLTLDQKVYDYTDYGEAPQIAIWMEEAGTGRIRTLFVTHRTAKGEWHGKIECPVSLPYWVSRYMKETGASGAPSHKSPLPDALSGATPQKDFHLEIPFQKGSQWSLFIEVNASGDYNRVFPSMLDNGVPDSQGNGQPSLVYKCDIQGIPNQTFIPRIAGRSLQMDATGQLIENLEGMDTAKKLFSDMEIKTSVSSVSSVSSVVKN